MRKVFTVAITGSVMRRAGARGGGLAKPLLLAVELDPATDLVAARPRVSKIDQLPTSFEGRLQLRLRDIAKRITE